RMIPELGDPDREVPVAKTFHEQTDDELTNKEVKQIEADDQAIQTILMSLPEDIYAAVDSCETAQEIIAVFMEYLVNISKRRTFWSLNEDILKINDSEYQYAVSIKEDTAYPCLHSPKTTKETSPIRRIQKRQYTVFKLYGNKIFWKISNVVSTPRNSNTLYPTHWIRRIESTSRQYK
ncbi:hypothetical protein Tco_0505487, partial [Tanacetum coccineum]